MLTNYLKVALRNILRHRTQSFINVFGLALGMTCCFLMLMWVVDEMSWDKFHKNAGTLFRVEQDQPTPQGPFHVYLTPYAMGPALVTELPEVQNATRVAFPGVLLVRTGEKVFYESNAATVDPSYLEMFSFPLVKGNRETVLRDPSSIVLTEDVAQKYFGNEDPLGKTLLINSKYPFTVTGVMRSVPANTNLRSNILLPFVFEKTKGVDLERWGSNEIVTWVQLHEGRDVAAVNTKISELWERHVLDQLRNTPGASQNPQVSVVRFQLMPLTDLRLYGKFGFGQWIGTIQSVSLFSALAVFILLIASINFMNLSTARSAARAKEVGLRKVVGAKRTSLAVQFYSESIVMTVFAAALSLAIVELSLPLFNAVSGKEFSYAAPLRPDFLLAIGLVVLLTATLSGTYPALFLSGFQPIQVLKGRFLSGGNGSVLRKLLVVFQFSLSVIMIVGTFAISRQLQYMRGLNLGYDKEQLIYLPLRGETKERYSSLKETLVKDPLVLGVSGTWQPPTSMSANGVGANWEGKDPNFRPLIGFGVVDYDYVKTMKISMAEGRSFSRDHPSDSTTGVLVNEAVAKLMGGGSVVGKRFSWGNNGTIIGVMKNYHYSRLQNAIEPLAVYLSPSQVAFAIVRLQAGNVAGSLDRVKAAWQRVNPSYPFEYKFFDEDFARMFEADQRMVILFRYASLFAIIVACLGLFGLASYMAEQRTREIGVRKVLGASIPEIAALLSKEFVKWVLVANIVAWPVAYFLLEKLLQNYAYRIAFLWWLYPLALLVTLGVALLTVSSHAIKAATANPVESLRYE
jgi:ABC-type antimicrobial peptide transport system permease subunit